MPITSLTQYYGSFRMFAEKVGKLLEGKSWVGIPFAGGMCEVAHIKARSIMVNDLHRGIHALAMMVKDPMSLMELKTELEDLPFHPDTLKRCQERSIKRDDRIQDHAYMQAAIDYFVVSWMTRAGTAGTPGELTGGLSLRWDGRGGDSNTRYRSAIDALDDWFVHFQRCSFSTFDAFDFLLHCSDMSSNGIYCDPPFVGPPGVKYIYNCGKTLEDQIGWHRTLERYLMTFMFTRIVVRAYDVKEIQDIYTTDKWTWHTFDGRKQTNAKAPEVLLVRN